MSVYIYQGITFEYAKRLYAQGCNVLIADVALRPECEDFLRTTPADGPNRVVFHRTDVTNWSQLEQAFDVAEALFKETPDIVCAGAGIYEPVSS